MGIGQGEGMNIRIVESPFVPTTKEVEDWSACRSPSRAKRRLKRGHPQRMKVVTVPRNEVWIVGGSIYGSAPVLAMIRNLGEPVVTVGKNL